MHAVTACLPWPEIGAVLAGFPNCTRKASPHPSSLVVDADHAPLAVPGWCFEIVPLDFLERMAAEGLVDLADFRILSPQTEPEFALTRSTPLYPEWPFSRVHGTPQELAQQVAIALMQMPRDAEAAFAGN